MATVNKVVKELLLTHTQLTADNPVLKNGQKVVVTGITDVINKPNKIGDNTTAYNSLPFLDVIKVQTSSDYDISGFAVDNNDVEVTNIGSSSINVTVDTVTVVITAGKIGKWRRVSGAWVQVVLPATDDVTHKIYSFDISAGNQSYTMDAVTSDMQIVELFWSGGDGSSNYFQVNDSGGTEIFRAYTSGNITYISDGSVFKVNDYKEILMDYDISTANKVHYLSKITGYPQDSRLSWSGGDGTYKLTISDDFGTTTLDYEGEGEGNAKLESDATAWKVVEYEDFLTSADTGDFSDITLAKRLDGIQEETFCFDTNGKTGTSLSNKFGSTSGTIYKYESTYTYIGTYTAAPKVYYGVTAALSGAAFNLPTTTNIVVRGYDTTDPFVTSELINVRLVGPWK